MTSIEYTALLVVVGIVNVIILALILNQLKYIAKLITRKSSLKNSPDSEGSSDDAR